MGIVSCQRSLQNSSFHFCLLLARLSPYFRFCDRHARLFRHRAVYRLIDATSGSPSLPRERERERERGETRIAAAIPSTVHFGRQVASCAALTKRCNFLESVLTAAPRRARKLQRYRARLTAARRRKIETEKVSSLAPAIRRIPFLSPFVAHSATFLTLCQPRRSALIRPLARCNPVNRPARQFH